MSALVEVQIRNSFMAHMNAENFAERISGTKCLVLKRKVGMLPLVAVAY